MPRDLATSLLPKVRRLWNLYGPTETTIWSTGFEVTADTSKILIGKPVANTQCYILDSNLQPVSLGATGELYLAGDGLALGYLNRPDLTLEKFVSNPFSTVAETRMYRTGDLARYHTDGNIECLGRIDHQVKIRGYRIELGEIESLLEQHEAVLQAVVVAQEDQRGDKILAAYVVLKPMSHASAGDLKSHLKQHLPTYMIPVSYESLSALPLTPNGKIDRKELRPASKSVSPQTSSANETNFVPWESAFGEATEVYVAPVTELEQKIAAIWSDMLSYSPVSVTDDFFDMGGHSLLAVRLLIRIKKELGIELPLAALMEAPTIAQLCVRAKSREISKTQITLRPMQADWPIVFLVPGAAGHTMAFRDLVQEITSDYNLVGMEASHAAGEEYKTIEQIASDYLVFIRQTQPKGPYHLLGLCFGAFVTMEMASQLRAEGEEVASMILLDPPTLPDGRPLAAWMEIIRVHSNSSLKNGFGRFGQVLRLIRKKGAAKRPNGKVTNLLPDEEINALDHFRDSRMVASLSYHVKPFSGNSLLVIANGGGTVQKATAKHQWARYLSGSVLVQEVSGDHGNFFFHPYAAALARAVDQVLTASDLATHEAQ